jgi:transcriptional regulator with XRE-family HTH domain
MPPEKFGTLLQSLRKRAGITPMQLARNIGAAPGEIAAWERDTARPDIAMVERLAVALGVPAFELLFGRSPTSAHGAAGLPLTEWYDRAGKSVPPTTRQLLGPAETGG